MARATRTTKRAADSGADPDLGNIPVEDPETGVADTLADLELEPWDGQADVWLDTEPGPGNRINIRRISPETWPHPTNGRETTVKGSLGDLPEGCKGDWIYSQFGGGYFQLTQFKEFKIVKAARLYIPGAPLVRDPNLAAGQPGVPSPAAAAAAAVGNVNVGGLEVPMTGDLEKTKAVLTELMLIQRMLERPDPNHELTNTLLKAAFAQRDNNSPSGQLAETLQLVNQVKDLLPSGDTGGVSDGPWLAQLIGQVLKALPALAQARPATMPVRPGAPMLPGQAPAQIPQLPETAAATQPQPDMEDTDMGSPPSWQEIAMTAVGHIVEHFKADPPTEPARVANLLDLAVPLKPEHRGQLAGYRQVLADYGKSGLVDYLADTPDKLKDWEPYFNQVFDLFSDPERQAKGLPDGAAN